MSNYNSNYEIAQAISERIGAEPIPFDSVYEICLQIYNELGGEPEQFDSVYEILLGILPLVGGGIASKVIDDHSIATDKTWSSSKINSEISAISGTANPEIEGKQTEDFTFVNSLPAEGEDGQQVIIKGENSDTLYKYTSGAWSEQTPDATKLYFDTEHEALYSYVTADHQFAPVSMVNTIVVGSNLNSNAALKALKTPGVYSVVQRLHNATKGDYVKNWTLYVESVDYEEYDRSDSIYQRLVSNYTIQKRTWSATRASNDGWSNFSTYYAGEIKDTTTSKYYTWSSNKIAAAIADAGFGVQIVQELPVSGDTHTIYFVPETGGETGDAYDEYMYVDNVWEKVGSTRIDLSEYEKKADATITAGIGPNDSVVFDFSALNNFTSNGTYTLEIQFQIGQEIYFKPVGYGKFVVENLTPIGAPGALQYIVLECFPIEGFARKVIIRMWNGTQWQEYASLDNPVIDDNNVFYHPNASTYSISKINQLLGAKQNTLTAGTGISISGDTISCTVQPTPALEAGQNVEIADNKIAAKGYFSDYEPKTELKSIDDIIAEAGASPGMPMGLKVSGAAGATTYTYTDNFGGAFAEIVQMGILPGVGATYQTVNGKSGVISAIGNGTITFEETLDADNALTDEPVDYVVYTSQLFSFAEGMYDYAEGDITIFGITLSGAAGATTYTYTDKEVVFESIPLGSILKLQDDRSAKLVSIDKTNNTASFETTFDADNSLTNALVVSVSNKNTASGKYSHAEGGMVISVAGTLVYANTASGQGSHAEGGHTIASSLCSHAEGGMTTASGQASHAEGTRTTASGNSSHAEGQNITASGDYTHAEGMSTTASSKASHAEGYETTARKRDDVSDNQIIANHAEGLGTIAQNQGEHAEGQYNVSHTAESRFTYSGCTQHSVGIGTGSSARKNALEIMQNGDVYVLGIGNYAGSDITASGNTVKTLQAYIASLEARIAALEGNSTVE